jgi:hypothetical protein
MAKKPKARGYEPHVRLQKHELDCAAYRSLSSDARSLLVEFRRIYNGRENRIYMSVRQAMDRMNVGQRPAQRALKELLDRGWIRVIEQGSFRRKVRHATVYALTNVPLEDRDGETAPKDYMHWSPPPQKNTVAETTTHSSPNGYRGGPTKPKKRARGSQDEYRQGAKSEFTVAEMATQINYQGGCAR